MILYAMDDSRRDVPATELRSRLAAYLDSALSGSEFTIYRGSRPTARLLPPDAEEMTFGEDDNG
jgi:antitoxin (DNA-binding transcriptional repressor) of toxin-antitoxin stability system